MSFLKAIWRGPSKHKKLSEDFVLSSRSEDPALEGVSFDVKYLGSTLVDTPNSEEATAEAIKTVITMAKASGKKLQRVALNVSLQGIRMMDTSTEEIHLEVSIYRISYCSADATYDHVFAFIATNSNDTMECHAFLCPKRKVAQAVTLTIAQSFNMAYELWQMSQGKQAPRTLPLKTNEMSSPSHTHNEDDEVVATEVSYNKLEKTMETLSKNRSHNLLIDLSGETPASGSVPWVCFEDDESANVNNSFTRFSSSHTSSSPTTTTVSVSEFNNAPRSANTPLSSPRTWSDSHSFDLLCS